MAGNEGLSFVIEDGSGSIQMSPGASRVLEHTRSSLEAAKLAVQQITSEFSEAMSNMPVSYEYVDLKFSLKFDAEAGIILTKIGTSASLDISVRVKPMSE